MLTICQLSPQFNHNATQPNITLVQFDTKMTLHTTTTTTTTHHKLNVRNISAVADPILSKLQKGVSGIIFNNNNNNKT